MNTIDVQIFTVFGSSVKCRAGAVLLVFGLLTPLSAEPTTNGPSTEANQARVDAFYEQGLSGSEQNPDQLVLPGLSANRKTRNVRLWAESTGVGAKEIVEFMLVGPGGGHDYESFAVSFARPGDIHRALTFIGMSAGRGVDFSRLAFWPKGERVRVEVQALDSLADPEKREAWKTPVRLESLIWREADGQPMDLSGLVFTGSRWVPSPEGGTQLVYAADMAEPRSIASNYNEPGTVLDVPHQAAQGSVYSSQLMRDLYVLPKHTLLELSLRPECEVGSERVQNLTLHISPLKAHATDLTETGFSVTDARGTVLVPITNLPAVVQFFSQCVERDQDPFVSLAFDAETPLRRVRRISILLASLESHKGIRIDPPLPGQLYYKAYFPDERHREREGRVSQPWELHLRASDKGVSAALIDIKETWTEDAPLPTLTTVSYELDSGNALRTQLDQALQHELKEDIALLDDEAARASLMAELDALKVEDLWGAAGEKLFNAALNVMSSQGNYVSMPDKVRRLRVILVYLDGNISHGDMMSFLQPVSKSHSTIHVYLTDAADAGSGPAQGE